MKLFRSQASYKAIGVGSRSDLEEMNRAIFLHNLHPVIDSAFDFADARAAYERLASRNILGKIVIRH